VARGPRRRDAPIPAARARATLFVLVAAARDMDACSIMIVDAEAY